MPAPLTDTDTLTPPSPFIANPVTVNALMIPTNVAAYEELCGI